MDAGFAKHGEVHCPFGAEALDVQVGLGGRHQHRFHQRAPSGRTLRGKLGSVDDLIAHVRGAAVGLEPNRGRHARWTRCRELARWCREFPVPDLVPIFVKHLPQQGVQSLLSDREPLQELPTRDPVVRQAGALLEDATVCTDFYCRPPNMGRVYRYGKHHGAGPEVGFGLRLKGAHPQRERAIV